MDPEPVSNWQVVRAIQDLAHEALESDTRIHERIDELIHRVQVLGAYVWSLERRIASLEGAPQSTDPPVICLQELD